MKKIILCLIMILTMLSCDRSKSQNTIEKENTKKSAGRLATNQPTPIDINYSLERYNLIKRAYWVNGQRDKANSLVPPMELPQGYVILFSNNLVVAKYNISGKVTSLNSFLTPDADCYTLGDVMDRCYFIADIDGSYGENDQGIFFFTTDGKYVEWKGNYLYSDMYMEIDNQAVKIVKE